MTNEEMDFWKSPEANEEKATSSEMEEEFMGTMKLKAPKPVFNVPTKCKIVDAKFFKNDKKEEDSKKNEYIAFFITITFKKLDGNESEFTETYRGGRLYDNNGTTSIYIGPASSLGRLKAACLDNGIKIGSSISDWKSALIGLDATLKSEIVQYAGKKYDKNFVYAVNK